MNTSIIIKIKGHDGNGFCRKFVYRGETFATLFATQPNERVFYEDQDGDKVIVDSDDDLDLALRLCNKGAITFSIVSTSKKPTKLARVVLPCGSGKEEERLARHAALAFLNNHGECLTPRVMNMVREHNNDARAVLSLLHQERGVGLRYAPAVLELQSNFDILVNEGFTNVRQIGHALHSTQSLDLARQLLAKQQSAEISWAQDIVQDSSPASQDSLDLSRARTILANNKV